MEAGKSQTGNERFVIGMEVQSMKGLIEAIEREGLKENVPQFNVGDTVKVGYRIIEGGKERIQNFEGVVIAKKHGSPMSPSSARAR